MKNLTQKERFFLMYFFGFDGYPPMSFTELSRLTNKSKQYYHELLSKIIDTLEKEHINLYHDVSKEEIQAYISKNVETICQI